MQPGGKQKGKGSSHVTLRDGIIKAHQSAPHDLCQNINYMPSGCCAVKNSLIRPHPSATPLLNRHPKYDQSLASSRVLLTRGFGGRAE